MDGCQAMTEGVVKSSQGRGSADHRPSHLEIFYGEAEFSAMSRVSASPDWTEEADK